MRNGRELVGDRDQQNAAVGTRCRFRGRGAAKDAILPAPHTMSLTTGQRPGPYEILASIGAGGMGEVYRARDTRLDRDVAIKVLPEGLSRDASFKLRFEREAKAISALNHPNICTLTISVARESSTISSLSTSRASRSPTAASFLQSDGRHHPDSSLDARNDTLRES